MPKLLLLPFTLLLISNTITAQLDPNARDLVLLTKWFEGEFDNDSQIWLENRRDWKGNPDEKHKRQHAIHQRIDAPTIGKFVFYVEEYLDNDLSNISRQRIVSFVSDPSVKGIRMQIFFLKEADKYRANTENGDLFNQITKKDLFDLDGCDVIFRRQGEQYHGSMEPKACQFGEGELRRYSVHDMVISKNQYWRVDRSFLVSNDKLYKGHSNDEPYKMRKVTPYTCNVSFHEKAYYIPSEKDKKYKDINIHNQGGMHWFDNPINGKKYAIQLREKEYPFYVEGSDFFMMRFIEEGKLASEVIVTGQPGAKSLSFQIGWASAHCKMMQTPE